jgi:hypothetical protein
MSTSKWRDIVRACISSQSSRVVATAASDVTFSLHVLAPSQHVGRNVSHCSAPERLDDRLQLGGRMCRRANVRRTSFSVHQDAPPACGGFS